MGGEKRHIFSRFDGDLGNFCKLTLEMGQLACEQIELGAHAVVDCDVGKSRMLLRNFRSVRDRDIGLLEANTRLLAIHQPLAGDLRYIVMLSRTAYDLERVNQEAVRMAEMVERSYERNGPFDSCELFDDVQRMSEVAVDMLRKALDSIVNEDVDQGIGVVNRQEKIERLSQGAQRRLATYIMQDPRNLPRVIEASSVLHGLERVADHAVSIAKNLIYACSGKDVRHVSPLNLNQAYLQS